MPDGKEIPCVKGGTKAKKNKKTKSTKASEKAEQEELKTIGRIAPPVKSWTRDGKTYQEVKPNYLYKKVKELRRDNSSITHDNINDLLTTPHYEGHYDSLRRGGSRKSRKSNRRRKTKLNRRKSRRIR
jgi:hypothetical protein